MPPLVIVYYFNIACPVFFPKKADSPRFVKGLRAEKEFFSCSESSVIVMPNSFTVQQQNRLLAFLRLTIVSRKTVNELLRERRSITPVMALRLPRLFGNSSEFWLSAQDSCDLWKSEQRHHEELSQILPLNKTTEKVFKDTDAHRNLIRCEDADDMFQKLGI